MEHFEVFRDAGHFAAWPANGGLWRFADGEVALLFSLGPSDYRTQDSVSHHKVPATWHIIRSFDGGRTWPRQTLRATGPILPSPEAAPPAEAPYRPLDPAADGYCLVAGPAMPVNNRAYAAVSTDRGHTWGAPVRMRVGLSSRPLYLAARSNIARRDDGLLLLAGNAGREPDENTNFPVVFASADGGASWRFLAEIEPSPRHPMAIQPAIVALPGGEFLLAVRRQYDGFNAFIQIYASSDGGRSWSLRSRANDWGAPASLTALPDGRVVCVFGHRHRPFGIQATISEDRGHTWGPAIVLRDDGGSWDLGYPRTVLLQDGHLLSVYYFNSGQDPVQFDGGVRHIAATRWRP